MVHFKPPEHFNFDEPNGWSVWRRTFLRYRQCTELHKKTQLQHIDCPVYVMGPQAKNIFTQLNLTADEAKVFDTVLTKFDNYYKPQSDIVFERVPLNQQLQKEGAPVV